MKPFDSRPLTFDQALGSLVSELFPKQDGYHWRLTYQQRVELWLELESCLSDSDRAIILQSALIRDQVYRLHVRLCALSCQRRRAEENRLRALARKDRKAIRMWDQKLQTLAPLIEETSQAHNQLQPRFKTLTRETSEIRRYRSSKSSRARRDQEAQASRELWKTEADARKQAQEVRFESELQQIQSRHASALNQLRARKQAEHDVALQGLRAEREELHQSLDYEVQRDHAVELGHIENLVQLTQELDPK